MKIRRPILLAPTIIAALDVIRGAGITRDVFEHHGTVASADGRLVE